jgi:hypothetical protein
LLLPNSHDYFLCVILVGAGSIAQPDSELCIDAAEVGKPDIFVLEESIDEISQNLGLRKFSVECQTTVTTIRQSTICEWEFLNDSDEWESMAISISLALEEELRQQTTADNLKKSFDFVAGGYEFNLSSLQQKSILSKKVRSIRRGTRLLNEWEAVYEKNSKLKLDLCRCENLISIQEKEIHVLYDQVSQHDKKIISLSKEVNASKQDFIDLTEKYKLSGQELLSLKNQLAAELVQKITVHKELKQMEQELVDEKTLLARTKSCLEEMSKQISDLEADNAKLVLEVRLKAAIEKELKDVEQELEKERDRVLNQGFCMQQMQARIAGVEAANDDLAFECGVKAVLEKDLKNLRHELQKEREVHANKESCIQELQVRTSDLQAVNVKLATEVGLKGAIEKELKDVKHELEQERGLRANQIINLQSKQARIVNLESNAKIALKVEMKNRTALETSLKAVRQDLNNERECTSNQASILTEMQSTIAGLEAANAQLVVEVGQKAVLEKELKAVTEELKQERDFIANHVLGLQEKEARILNLEAANTDLHLKVKINEVLKKELKEVKEELSEFIQKQELSDQSSSLDSFEDLEALETANADLEAEISTLRQESLAFSSQLDYTSFQLTILQLLQATRTKSLEGSSLRIACSMSSVDGSLHKFGKWVAKVFADTRVSHRKNLDTCVRCEPPEYEVTGVDAVINSELADRYRQFILHAESTEAKAAHRYTAHRVASSVQKGMKLHNIQKGSGAFDEQVLLGWHGASDEVTAEIIADGFNPCCAGSGAGSLFGKGLYFAENSSKADLYAGPKDNRFKKCTDEMSVILAVIYCGNMYETKQAGAWTNPPKPTNKQVEKTRIKR